MFFDAFLDFGSPREWKSEKLRFVIVQVFSTFWRNLYFSVKLTDLDVFNLLAWVLFGWNIWKSNTH